MERPATPLIGRKARLEAGPEGIVVDERGDLAFEMAALGEEEGR